MNVIPGLQKYSHVLPSADTLGSIWISVRASRNALSSLPSFSCPWHLLNKAFESFGKIFSAAKKEKETIKTKIVN